MSTVIYDSLGEDASELFQSIIPQKDQCIEHIRPHLIVIGSPSGSLKLELRSNDDKKINESNSVSINSITSTNFHGVVKFDIQEPIQSGIAYRVVLTSSGYSFSESDHVGWVNDFDQRLYGVQSVRQKELGSPKRMEIFESKNDRRIRNGE